MNLEARLEGLLTTAELAARPDFALGQTVVSPSTRTVRGPGGRVDVEPRVMQVLVVLADANGAVVTRDTLFHRCWGSPHVGDDSLNRAIAGVRRLASGVGGGSFEIETVPRTGYRLVVEDVGRPHATSDEAATVGRGTSMSRRLLLGGGAAAAAAAGGAGLWWTSRPRTDPRFDALMARGDEAFRDGTAFEWPSIIANDSHKMIGLYEEAVRLNPNSARAWGLLSYFRSAKVQGASSADSEALVASAQAAFRRALEIDPTEPNARVAKFLLDGQMLDWIERDRQLRQILATEPKNLPAMMELMPLLQAAGLTRESWIWNERILSASPLARPYLVVRAMKLWILGRIRESDNVIDRVRGLWPDYGFGFSVRFLIFAVTGRPLAALAMLDSAPDRLGDRQEIDFWRTVLPALETRAPAAIDSARRACLKAARESPPLVNDAVMILGALGEVDAAFEVTDGFLLWRGKVVSVDHANGKAMDDYSRRMTQWLFTPPVAIMRADPRFLRLCDEFGLVDYWRARGVKPDYQRYG